MSLAGARVLPHLIGGRELTEVGASSTPVHNPSSGEIIALAPAGSAATFGVPAPTASSAFSGWGDSFLGDLHLQGKESVMFYTRQRAVVTRWDGNSGRHLGW